MGNWKHRIPHEFHVFGGPLCRIWGTFSSTAGHIFVHGEDIVPKWRGLVAGSMVEFILYFDGISARAICGSVSG